MKSLAASAVFLVSLTSATGAASPSRDEVTSATVLAVERWVSAVVNHAPGHRDASVEMVAAMTFDKRKELDAGMKLFLSGLNAIGVVTTTAAQKQIVSAARGASVNPGAGAFLKRAAILHADAAFKNRLDNGKPADPGGAPPAGAPTSPLLFRHQQFLNKDGEILGEVPADWNWPFARSLLDLLSPRPADDPFVGAWYHATTAFMLQQGLYGDAVTHLARAAEVLPDDPRVLFNRACYAEIQGLPVSQVLLSDTDILALRAQRAGRRGFVRTPTGFALSLGIPPPEVANEEAERLFRRTLRVDPTLVEARVRLGRLLEERKKYEEAAGELSTALAAKPTGVVAFYAYLFAGRAAQALGRLEQAGAHYRAAAAMFPGAQSSLLAQSQLALLASDLPGALEPIAHLDQSSTARDPWWQYALAAGRDADAILRDMWAQFPR